MLEGLVAWVLNNYVGEYFENLNTHQLSIALLQGQVELENVPLKKTALRKFDIPLQVQSGVIGRLTLTIPMHMRSEPWILKMSDVLVLLEPSTAKYDVEFVEQYEQSKKQTALDELEQYHKRQLLAAIGESIKVGTSADQNQWWGASLVSAVTNNMQVILDNVHIRYEDVFRLTEKHSEQPFNFGIRIENITMQTTNSLWRPTFVQPTADGTRESNIFKKLDIKRLSFYWNCSSNSTQSHKPVSVFELKRKMSPENTKHNAFVLQPFCMEVRMEKNSSKFPLKTLPLIPRFKFDLRPEKIEIDFSKNQLAQIRFLAREWARFDRERQHRKWRPRKPVLEDPRAWWNFANNRVMDGNRRRHCWRNKNTVLTRVRHFNIYCKAYRRRLESFVTNSNTNDQSSSSTENQESGAFMRQVEHSAQFTYDELHLFRETVYRRFLRELDGQSTSAGNEDDVEIFEVISSKERPNSNAEQNILPNEAVEEMRASPSDERSGGWYGWLSSWFGKDDKLEETQEDEDVNKAFFLDLRPKVEEKNLSPELKEAEKRMEEEILDVLSETWDDSTILRRDNLFAELVFRLDKIIVRFIDNGEENENDALFSTCNRILSLDLRRVVSRIHLSPREHRTEVSLSVEEMSVQRLQFLPSNTPLTDFMEFQQTEGGLPDLSEMSSADSVWGSENIESLLYGMSNLNTQLLLTIGRTKEDEEELLKEAVLDEERRFKKNQKNPKSFGKHKSPMLQLFYKRLAPKLDVYHELNIQLSPIFAMYDEEALNGLFTLFSTEAPMENKFSEPNNTAESIHTHESTAHSRLFLTLTVSKVSVELRRRNLSLLNTKDEIPNAKSVGVDGSSFSFALATLVGLKLQLVNSEAFISKIKLLFQSVIVEDLFEKQAKINWPLIKSVSPIDFLDGGMTSYSNLRSLSCPDLRTVSDDVIYSTGMYRCASLPDRLNSAFTSEQKISIGDSNILGSNEFPRLIAKNHGNFMFNEECCKMVSIVFVDNRHPRFVSEHAKQHCSIVADFKNELEIGMNRRSWITLLDFFGLLGSNDVDEVSTNTEILRDAKHNKKAEATVLSDCYNFRCEVKVDLAKISMNYPCNGTQLGVCSMNNCLFGVRMNLNNLAEPISIRFSMLELVLSDLTPFYGQFYDQRLIVKRSNSQNLSNKDEEKDRIFFEILKYRTDDPLLKRYADMELRLNVSSQFHASYVHTHRYFFAFLEFWTDFAELQDRVFKQNQPLIKRSISKSQYQKTRCKLDVNFTSGLEVVVPLNQLCEEVIIFATTKFTIQNYFTRASSISSFVEHGIDHCGDVDDYDCLLDAMNVFCGDLKIFRGMRILTTSKKAKTLRKASLRYALNSHYFFSATPSFSILSRLVDVKIDIFRNLSNYFSHRVPDFVVITELADVELLLNAQFYCLLRGVLDQNIGEQFFQPLETVPVELQKKTPDYSYEIGMASKYATFCFRMLLRNAKFNFSTVVDNFSRRDDGTGHESFARMELHNAKISFDAYVDGQYELYLICQSMELVDSRFEGCESSPNVFTSVISARNQSQGKAKGLMFEAHIMVKKDGPPIVTLVLLNARVLLIFDWLLHAKDFLLQTTNFIAPQENRSAGNYLYEVPKEGVLVRTIYSAVNPAAYYDTNCHRHQARSQTTPDHTFTLKITLKEMDLVTIEDTTNPKTMALVAFTTGVLTADDSAGILQGNVEIQKVELFWCSLSAKEDNYINPKILTNDFSVAIALSLDLPQTSPTFCDTNLSGSSPNPDCSTSRNNLSSRSLDIASKSSNESLIERPHFRGTSSGATTSSANSGIEVKNRGIQIIDLLHQRQKISLELNDKVEVKFSQEDFRAVQNILTYALERWVEESTFSSTATSESTLLTKHQANCQPERPPVSISKIYVRCSYLSACLMDTQVSMPLLRFVMTKLVLEKCIDRLNASMTLGVDYFNDMNFGFEPFVEPWNVEKLSIQWHENHINVDIMPGNDSVFNINLTQNFIQQAKRFVAKPSRTEHLSSELSKIRPARLAPVNLRDGVQKKSFTGSSAGLLSFNVTLFIPAGIGVSLINRRSEELVYLLFRGVKIHLLKQDTNYQFNTHVDVVQADNQLVSAERWQFLYCEPKLILNEEFSTSANAAEPSSSTSRNSSAILSEQQRKNSNAMLKKHRRTASSLSVGSGSGGVSRPALCIEVSYTPTSGFDTFEHFRVRLCDSSILLDETLLWKIVEMISDLSDSANTTNALKKSLSIVDEACLIDDSLKPTSSTQTDKRSGKSTSEKDGRNCFFDVLELEIGNVLLSALAVSDNSLSAELRALKKKHSITLVSFENALVSISSFRKHRYFANFDQLFKSMGAFYLAELKKQKLSIIVTMDAFGNPMGLATDFKDSIEGLIFEGDVGGFVFGLGYGVTNSISKVASSMSQGVGFLTFDEQHEQMRRRMLRGGQSQAENSTALSHLYGGVKGLGVGVFGGLTAIAKNTYTATQKDGVSGLFRGVTTGALDTVTKPLQGALDLLEGTASAFKEAVGSPLMRKSQFSECRLRLPRVCTSFNSRLPAYSYELAEAQQHLLRINSYSSSEVLFDVVKYYNELSPRGDRVEYRAMICSEQCYILKQINQDPCTVAQRIIYKYLQNIQPAKFSVAVPRGIVPLEITYLPNTNSAKLRGGHYHEQLWCMSAEIANELSLKMMKARNFYARSVQRSKTAASSVPKKPIMAVGAGISPNTGFSRMKSTPVAASTTTSLSQSASVSSLRQLEVKQEQQQRHFRNASSRAPPAPQQQRIEEESTASTPSSSGNSGKTTQNFSLDYR